MNTETLFLLFSLAVANTMLALILWIGVFSDEDMEFDKEFWWIWIPPLGIVTTVLVITIVVTYLIPKIIWEKITNKLSLNNNHE